MTDREWFERMEREERMAKRACLVLLTLVILGAVLW